MDDIIKPNKYMIEGRDVTELVKFKSLSWPTNAIFCLGNVLKYIIRYNGNTTDLLKAREYLNRMIDQ